MTWILAVATLGVLGSIALACHRAAADAAERLCDCVTRSVEAPATLPVVASDGPGSCPAHASAPTLAGPPGRGRGHLRVVGAG